jgi:hypothetical protein
VRTIEDVDPTENVIHDVRFDDRSDLLIHLTCIIGVAGAVTAAALAFVGVLF